MKKLLCIASVLCGMVVAAEAEPAKRAVRITRAVQRLRPGAALVTRTAADRYVDHRTNRTIRTEGCTVTATVMDARIVPDPMGRPGLSFLVFLDGEGREEGECLIHPAARPMKAVGE